MKETVALDNVEITLEAAEFVAVMGPSGSGKSSLLNILSGFDSATAGEVYILDTNVTSLERDELAKFRRSNIGYVFQEYNLLDSLTLKENIMLPMVLDNKGQDEMQQRADELMNILGISQLQAKYPHNVSGGEQQRTAICRALINKTSIVFADEPTGSLDSKSSKTVLECFKQINRIHGITILMVTHDPLAASYSDRVLFLKDGGIRTQLYRDQDQQAFYQQILDNLAALEDVSHDF